MFTKKVFLFSFLFLSCGGATVSGSSWQPQKLETKKPQADIFTSRLGALWVRLLLIVPRVLGPTTREPLKLERASIGPLILDEML